MMQQKHFELMHAHKNPDKFSRLELWAQTHCILYAANNQQTSQTLFGMKQTNKQTSPHSALRDISKKRIVCSHICDFVLLFDCLFGVYSKLHMFVAQPPVFDYSQLCVRSDSVFHLRLDRSKLLESHVARATILILYHQPQFRFSFESVVEK